MSALFGQQGTPARTMVYHPYGVTSRVNVFLSHSRLKSGTLVREISHKRSRISAANLLGKELNAFP